MPPNISFFFSEIHFILKICFWWSSTLSNIFRSIWPSILRLRHQSLWAYYQTVHSSSMKFIPYVNIVFDGIAHWVYSGSSAHGFCDYVTPCLQISEFNHIINEPRELHSFCLHYNTGCLFCTFLRWNIVSSSSREI